MKRMNLLTRKAKFWTKKAILCGMSSLIAAVRMKVRRKQKNLKRIRDIGQICKRILS